jgi:hypothetical protein
VSDSPFRLSEKLVHPPAKCLVTGDIDGPFVDFGSWGSHNFEPYESYDPHVALSVGVVKEAGKLCGMVPREDVERLKERVEKAEAELEQVKAHAATIQRVLDAEAALAAA